MSTSRVKCTAAPSKRHYITHDNIVQLLITNGDDVNLQGGHYGSALQAAAYRGQENTVQLLLTNGANVNLQGGDYDSALQAASFRGFENIVANVNLRGWKHSCALQAALHFEHKNIVQLLLTNRAKASSKLDLPDCAE